MILKSRTVISGIRLLALLAGVLLGFFTYSGIRTLGETVGFSWSVTLNGLAVIAILFLFPYLLTVACLHLAFGASMKKILPFLKPLVASLLVGSVIAETAILYDESVFAREVAANPSMNFYRDRAWPLHGCSLIYIPEKGFFATD